MGAALTLGLTALIAFAGSFVQSACGFGHAVICMSFLPLLMPFRTASILEAVTAFFMVVYLTARLFCHISWRLLWPPMLVSAAFGFLGVSTLLALSDHALRRILGAALLLLAAYFIFLSGRVRLKGSLLSGLAAGTISGFLSGLFNIGGPPMVAYYLSVTDDKNTYNATLQAYFCFNTVSIFCIHLLHGSVTAELIPLAACAVAGTGAGTALGFLLFKRMSLARLKQFIYGFMLAAGAYLLILA